MASVEELPSTMPEAPSLTSVEEENSQLNLQLELTEEKATQSDLTKEIAEDLKAVSENDSDVEDNAADYSSGEFGENAFSIHLQRQALLCKFALQAKYKYLPESVSKIGAAFEEFIFNPYTEEDKKQQEPRLNFYPPFCVPECTANYYSFFSILSLPYSCCANRTGTKKLKELQLISKYESLPEFDEGLFTVSEALGSEVTATDSLPRTTRLVTLDADYERLITMKSKLRHVTRFAYPALNLPPKIHKVLIENLFKPYQTGKEAEEEVDYVFTVPMLAALLKISDEQANEKIVEFRKNLLKAIQYLAVLKMMEKYFRNAGFIKKMQEILHYTFHHGFVRLIGHVTGQNLSRFITYHCMTFENRNNNCNLQSTLDLNDGEDYMVDSIFLFLVLTWQTVMGIWQQNLSTKNMSQLERLLMVRGVELVYCKTADEMAEKIAVWISDDDVIIKIFQEHLPDFISQTQINNFRQFILARSNIAGGLVPAMIKDFVPVDFKESSPLLWSHVYLLQLSYYLYRHGDYMQIFFINDGEFKSPDNEVFCNCNLCAPHRTPMYNSALHNEILAIDTFDFFVPTKDGKSGERVTLSAGMWANKYLNHFVQEEFFPFDVYKYLDYPEKFHKQPTACVITKPDILSTIKFVQQKREKFLLEKGSGIYLDPDTGDNLSDAKFPPQSREKDSRKYSSKRRTEQKIKQKEEEDSR
ncbi:100K [Skua adenovirus 1]|uniref:100K n=1 Tax=South Polar skua adenovirus 1 TaxID=2848087 RepID=G9B6K9_9ADEN|nr:100K [Skua adenovirus 1]ADP30825.1 100K [Skua adenovirus 1]